MRRRRTTRLPRVYIYAAAAYGDPPEYVLAAVSEDGRLLAHHISPDLGSARRELHDLSHPQAAYVAKFGGHGAGEFYDLVELQPGEAPPAKVVERILANNEVGVANRLYSAYIETTANARHAAFDAARARLTGRETNGVPTSTDPEGDRRLCRDWIDGLDPNPSPVPVPIPEPSAPAVRPAAEDQADLVSYLVTTGTARIQAPFAGWATELQLSGFLLSFTNALAGLHGHLGGLGPHKLASKSNPGDDLGRSRLNERLHPAGRAARYVYEGGIPERDAPHVRAFLASVWAEVEAHKREDPTVAMAGFIACLCRIIEDDYELRALYVDQQTKKVLAEGQDIAPGLQAAFRVAWTRWPFNRSAGWDTIGPCRSTIGGVAS